MGGILKKYKYVLLAGLILIAGVSYVEGAQRLLTGISGALTPEYLFVSKSIFFGNDATNDNSLISTGGIFRPPTSTDSLYLVDLEGQVNIGNDCVSNCQAWGVILDPLLHTRNSTNPKYLTMLGGYPGFYHDSAQTLTDMTVINVSYQDYQNEAGGTVTNFNFIEIDAQGIADVTNGPTKTWGIRTKGGDQAGGNIRSMQNNLAGRTIIGNEGTSVTNAPLPSMVFEPVTFANLTAAPNGTFTYCSDCNPANCTAGASTGSFCKRQNGAWLPM